MKLSHWQYSSEIRKIFSNLCFYRGIQNLSSGKKKFSNHFNVSLSLNKICFFFKFINANKKIRTKDEDVKYILNFKQTITFMVRNKNFTPSL